MLLKFHYLQETVVKQESQIKETLEQGAKRQRKCCSIGRSEAIQREDDPGFFKNQQGSQLKCNVDNTVEDAKKQMTAQTSTSWYKSILKM